MTIEFNGHVQSMTNTGAKGQVVAIRLEMARANGQVLEVAMTPEEARMYMPGKGITLRFWPNDLKPSPPDFATSAEGNS